jgi:hypothetical protein
MQDMITQLDNLANEFNTSRELRKKWNQQSVDLKNAMNKVLTFSSVLFFVWMHFRRSYYDFSSCY